MPEVSETLVAVKERIESVMTKAVVVICDTMPSTFRLGYVYILAPDSVRVEHMMNDSSLQEFDVEIVTPTHEFEGDRQETLSKNVLESLAVTNAQMHDCFNRIRIIGGACISDTDYGIQNWEVNGFIYASSDVTLHFKSILSY